MKLSTLEFLRLLPEFMRDDPAIKGLADAVEDILASPAQEVPNATVWNRIDQMDEAQLDELAWELDIDLWSTSWCIATKRATAKSSDRIYQKRGTKWAVEQVVKDVFYGGYVMEWTEYSGEPFHFRISTEYPLQDAATVERFYRLVARAKRASARLDEIEFAQNARVKAYCGAAACGVSVCYSGFAANV